VVHFFNVIFVHFITVINTLTTTYHIQGAGAPAKTENYVNADATIAIVCVHIIQNIYFEILKISR
ncbi:MAG: hypothetical protein ACLRLD_04695, partial [Lachnospira sp.]